MLSAAGRFGCREVKKFAIMKCVGSGKGKARRARTVVPVSPRLAAGSKDRKSKARKSEAGAKSSKSADGAKKQELDVGFYRGRWDRFVTDSGMQNKSLYGYYLGYCPDYPDEAENEKVLAELFADAVDLGAITLPSPYKLEDFQLKKMGSEVGDLEISLRKNPQSREPQCFTTWRFMGTGAPMYESANLLDYISQGIDKLIN